MTVGLKKMYNDGKKRFTSQLQKQKKSKYLVRVEKVALELNEKIIQICAQLHYHYCQAK